MNVLVVGAGGREHALVWRLRQENPSVRIVVAPGNPGIAEIAECVPIGADVDALVEYARQNAITWTLVGPEAPLGAGIVDAFRLAKLAIFGPTKAGAMLETSKAFSKTLMTDAGVPTARAVTCTDLPEAYKAISEIGAPLVIKASGLAAGKGVIICETTDEARSAAAAMLEDGAFGAAGDTILVEEFMDGEELSVFVMTDGERVAVLPSAQDHKRLLDGDRGPNTGGMGAFAPSRLVDAAMRDRIMREIVEPVIAGMTAEGHPFRGFLYAGLMLTAGGPKVIEFNVRLGDPEAQVILPLIDEPLAPLLAAAAAGELRQAEVRIADRCLTGVVMASRGYPESSESGVTIAGIDRAEKIAGVAVYHAGTARKNGQLVTAGGRVLTVVGSGGDFTESMTRAYAGVLQIGFEGMQFRHDIGRKALVNQS